MANYGTYVIEVDWSGNGSFSDSGDDITADVKEISIARGKDSQIGKCNPGRLTIRVRNDHKKYTPEYSSGPLYGYLLPKKEIRVRTTSPVAKTLFRGFIEDIIPHPHWNEKDAHISAIDGLDYLARHELDTVLWKDRQTGVLVNKLLDVSDWPDKDPQQPVMPGAFQQAVNNTARITSVGSSNPCVSYVNAAVSRRLVDGGKDAVPFAYWSKQQTRFALSEIEDSEHGLIYVNGEGQLAYEDRHHRYSATHQTSQFDMACPMAGVVNVTYEYGAKHIFNEVRATVTPWELQAIADLWELQETPELQPGETLTYWGDFQYFADEITTPVATTDYTANSQADGGGDNHTTDLTIAVTKFAKAVKIDVTNAAAVPVFITLLKVRGTYYDDLTTVTRKSVDATSQRAYQKRTLQLDGKFLTDALKAQQYCDYGIQRFKDPQAEVSVTLTNANETVLTQMLNREISDRVTLSSDELGIDTDFFIDYIEHRISMAGRFHQVTWRLADAENEEFWCLGYSGLGVGTKVCY